MKKMKIFVLAILPILVFTASGCYTQYDRSNDNYDRDYRSGSYSDYDDYADTNYNSSETTINNYYSDGPYYKRYFWGYHPGISIGFYSDYYSGGYWGSYVDWPWCGTYYPSYWWNWYPVYDNYCYYYPGYHHGNHWWKNGHNGDIKYRDNNTYRMRDNLGLRNSGGGRTFAGRDGSTVTTDTRLRSGLSSSRERGTDRIGSLRSTGLTRQRDDNRTTGGFARGGASRVRETETGVARGGSSWSRNPESGTVTTGRTRTGSTDTRTAGRSRDDAAARPSRENDRTTDRSGTVRQRESGTTGTGSVSRPSSRETQREGREAKPNREVREKQKQDDRQQKSSIREYQQRSREQKREERKLYSTPRSDGQQNSTPSLRNRESSGHRESAPSREGSSRREYSAPPSRSNAPSSAPAPRNSNPPSRNDGGSDSRRTR